MIIIDAPHFNAAVVINATSLRVMRAAPILSYMMGWDRMRVLDCAERRGWRYEMRD
ncbi:hypothetical protein [Bradyrhizobium sp. 2S1]|uniref:hypothetical protein n=1 Tax=Bradyrhizobium sp. 2S1 TaxID=1404429 RepID=UPI00140A63F9|nr:hypothetical protein [Bradyrhizobium sp. 2S1]MCK7672402.1 hypothetical protein [Bradyrhizobium sp. 2S1]